MAYNNRASLNIDLKNIEAALDDIEKAISIDHEYAPAYNNKGVICHQQEKYIEALSFFDKAKTSILGHIASLVSIFPKFTIP